MRPNLLVREQLLFQRPAGSSFPEIQRGSAFGRKTWKSDPSWHQKYQSLGDLIINLHVNFDFTDHGYDVLSYRRELVLDTAIVTIPYRTGSINLSRKIFIGLVDDVLVIWMTSGKPGTFFFYVPSGEKEFEIMKLDASGHQSLSKFQLRE